MSKQRGRRRRNYYPQGIWYKRKPEMIQELVNKCIEHIYKSNRVNELIQRAIVEFSTRSQAIIDLRGSLNEDSRN